MNSDFYNDQKAVSSPFSSEHIAVTDEMFKRQEKRGREGRREGGTEGGPGREEERKEGTKTKKMQQGSGAR